MKAHFRDRPPSSPSLLLPSLHQTTHHFLSLFSVCVSAATRQAAQTHTTVFFISPGCCDITRPHTGVAGWCHRSDQTTQGVIKPHQWWLKCSGLMMSASVWVSWCQWIYVMMCCRVTVNSCWGLSVSDLTTLQLWPGLVLGVPSTCGFWLRVILILSQWLSPGCLTSVWTEVVLTLSCWNTQIFLRTYFI